MAAFLLVEGNSLGSLFQRGLLTPIWTPFKDNTTYPDYPSQSLYADVEHSDMLYYKSKLSPTASIALLGPGPSHTGFCDVNVTYLKTENDLAIPFDTQRIMIEEAESFCRASRANPGAGGRVVSHTIKSSHSPFLSQPAAVVELVDEVFRSLEGASTAWQAWQCTQHPVHIDNTPMASLSEQEGLLGPACGLNNHLD